MNLMAPVQWLIDFLTCLARYAVGLLTAGLVTLVNFFLAGLMAILSPILSLLPTINLDPGSAPQLLALANWLLPLDQFVIISSLVVALLGSWHLVAIGLRWLKVVE